MTVKMTSVYKPTRARSRWQDGKFHLGTEEIQETSIAKGRHGKGNCYWKGIQTITTQSGAVRPNCALTRLTERRMRRKKYRPYSELAHSVACMKYLISAYTSVTRSSTKRKCTADSAPGISCTKDSSSVGARRPAPWTGRTLHHAAGALAVSASRTLRPVAPTAASCNHSVN